MTEACRNKGKKMKLDLTIEEINLVLSALAKAPYEVVYQVIHKIQDQAQSREDSEK